MEIQALKWSLLATGLIIENDYLDKYLALLSINYKTKKEYGKTQQHHIFPKCLSKVLNIPVKEDVINLSYKDHILAHYYLIYATNNSKLKIANIHAFNKLLKLQGHWLSENILIDLLEKQQLIYEQTRELRSEQSRKQNSGGCYVNNGIKSKHIKVEELDDYLANGWVRGQIQHHDKIRGTITINNGQAEKRIKPELLKLFLADNWTVGKITGYKKSGKNNQNKISVYSAELDKELRIDQEQLSKFLELNPSYIVGSKKRKPYKKIKQGYKNGQASKGRIWINKENKSKMIFPAELDLYLMDGWNIGRIKK